MEPSRWIESAGFVAAVMTMVVLALLAGAS
jgi:hypothetical protein